MLNVNVRKKFDDFVIDADWSAKGDVTCLFGYTGSGKSLTLKMIAGLLEPDRGSITFNDKTFYDSKKGLNVPPQSRDIGFAFQNNMLFPHMTVYQNILYGLKNGNGKDDLVNDVIKILRLKSLEDKFPNQISGGQQQRTAIARAVIRRPKLLLLDEPFNSLDHAVRKKMYKDLKHYQKYFKIPIILVTHDMDELHSLADWVVLYNEGSAIQAGRPEDVFMRPADRVAARLVGTKNIFDGEVTGEGLLGCEVTTKTMRLFATNNDNVWLGDKVIICIRPEHISIVENSADAEENRKNVIRGTIVNMIKNVDSFDLFLRTADNVYDIEAKVSREDHERLGLAVGMGLTVRIDANRVHLFQGVM